MACGCRWRFVSAGHVLHNMTGGFRRPLTVARTVKVKMSNYALKRPGDRCVEVEFLAELRFLEAA